MRVLALTKYGPLAASTRQRFLQYRPAFREAGIELEISPLLGDDHLRRLVAGKRASPAQVLRAYTRRLFALLRARRFDLIWVHCELFPYLPGAIERLVGLAARPIVYDCDDAIFHNYDESRRTLVRTLLGNKLHALLSLASACTCGNPYVQAYCLRHCPRSLVVPTVVDTDLYRPAAEPPRTPVIGWIGSPSTWRDVRPYLPLLQRIHEETGARFRAVGAGEAARADLGPGIELAAWSEEREIAEVQGFSIGIMPLADAPFQRGKSGYKLIQYMGCGLPTVASPIGVNGDIVREGETGFLPRTMDDWEEVLRRLLGDPALRPRLGEAGRERAVRCYSLASQAPRLIDLFTSLVR